MSAEFPGNGLLCTSPRVMGVIARSTFVTSASIKKADTRNNASRGWGWSGRPTRVVETRDVSGVGAGT